MICSAERLNDLETKIAALPRVSIAALPTPLQDVPRLTSFLGGPRLLFKRDDLTGLALGGNKTRMMEFRLVHALLQGADTVIAGYGIQSNHACQVAAACNRLGLQCHLVLRDEDCYRRDDPTPQGNRLLFELLGAKTVVTDRSVSEQISMMKDLAENLRAVGRKPFITGVDDYDLSTVAYAACMAEMCHQFHKQKVNPDAIVLCADGGTQAGLVMAAKYLGMKTRIIGIAPMRRIDRPGRETDITVDIARLANLCARALDVDTQVLPEDVTNLLGYVGEGYGLLNRETVEAIRTVARTEGIILDPVYTGKAMAGLADLIRRKEIGQESTVVFIHTGGYPLLPLYADDLCRSYSNL